MIHSFACSDTEALHARNRVRRFANIESVARRKLRQLDVAARLPLVEMVRLCGRDVTVAPGDRAAPIHGAQRPALMSACESS